MTAVAPQSPRAARLPVSPSSLRLCRAACPPRTVQSRTGGESHTHTHTHTTPRLPSPILTFVDQGLDLSPLLLPALLVVGIDWTRQMRRKRAK